MAECVVGTYGLRHTMITASTRIVPEVVSKSDLGFLVQSPVVGTFTSVNEAGITDEWSRNVLVNQAQSNTWDKVAKGLPVHFEDIVKADMNALQSPMMKSK